MYLPLSGLRILTDMANWVSIPLRLPMSVCISSDGYDPEPPDAGKSQASVPPDAAYPLYPWARDTSNRG